MILLGGLRLQAQAIQQATNARFSSMWTRPSGVAAWVSHNTARVAHRKESALALALRKQHRLSDSMRNCQPARWDSDVPITHVSKPIVTHRDARVVHMLQTPAVVLQPLELLRVTHKTIQRKQ